MPGGCSRVPECDSVHYTLYVYVSGRKQVLYDRRGLERRGVWCLCVSEQVERG